ncbi:DUF881 domain-containing protein [Phosphitispora sp. TUW77]|uniref:DUF881 domain-containing protein n=1 Tax=Phosphitispora sp. TUW77 TaxID=3152361 RepID=UPI003AB3C42A
MKRGQISLAIVLLFLGMMIAVQVRTTKQVEQNVPSARIQELTTRLKEVKEERDSLIIEVADLRTKLNKVTAGGNAGQAIRDELAKSRMQAGVLPVQGNGVEVKLDDSPKQIQPGEDPNLYILHEEDLLKVVNELRAGGAEAISINGQRILATSEIRCAGNTILVNTKKIVPPIIILATGNPDTLKSGLEIKGGIFEQLKYWGLVALVDIKDNITIPGYTGPVTFNYTRVLDDSSLGE